MKVKFFVSISLQLITGLFCFSCLTPKNPQANTPKMFLHQSSHHNYYQSDPVEEQPEILWQFKTDGQVVSSPVVSDGVVYVGSEDHRLYALDAETGLAKWHFQTEGPISSTPAVSYDKVFFLSYDGNFYALNKGTGKLQWKFSTGGESKFKVKDYFNGSFQPDFWDFFLSSPALDPSTVYFGSSDGNIYALDRETGKKRWSYRTGASIHSSPALYENYLVTGAWDSRIYCLDKNNGAIKWVYTTGRDTTKYIWMGIQASPSIDEGIAFIGSRDAKLYALQLETGDTLWTQSDFEGSWLPGSAAIDQTNLYCGSSDAFSFYSIDKLSGRINYRTNLDSYAFSSPAVINEMAYLGAANGRLYGINLDDGLINWEFQTNGSRTDSIRLFNQQGKLDTAKAQFLLKDIKDMPTLSALYQKIFGSVGAILSSPSIANGILYFGSCDGHIYAISSKIP